MVCFFWMVFGTFAETLQKIMQIAQKYPDIWQLFSILTKMWVELVNSHVLR